MKIACRLLITWPYAHNYRLFVLVWAKRVGKRSRVQGGATSVGTAKTTYMGGWMSRGQTPD